MATTIPEEKWEEAADLILGILPHVRAEPAVFAKEAATRGITWGEPVTAVITEALRSVVFKGF